MAKAKKADKSANEEIEIAVEEQTKPAAKKKSAKKTPKKPAAKSKSSAGESYAVDLIKAISAEKKAIGDTFEIGFLDEIGANVTDYQDTGSYVWNYICSGKLTKGLPYGRVVEVHGENSTGKSLLATQIACMAQKDGNLPIYCDTEYAFDENFAKRLGANPKGIITALGLKTIEGFDKYFSTAAKNIQIQRAKHKERVIPVAVFLDSLGMLSTEHELKEPSKSDMTKPKKIRRFFRAYMHDCYHSNIMLFVIAQVYKNINAGMFANDEEVSGGMGLPYAASIRFSLKKPKVKLKDKNDKLSEVSHTAVRVKTIKNRVDKPFRACFVHFSYQSGIDRYGGFFEFLFDGKFDGSQYKEVTSLNLIQKAKTKGKFVFPEFFVDEKGENIEFKRNEFVDIFKENELEYLSRIQEIIDYRTENNLIVDQELDEDEKAMLELEEGGDSEDQLLKSIKV